MQSRERQSDTERKNPFEKARKQRRQKKMKEKKRRKKKINLEDKKVFDWKQVSVEVINIGL